MDDQLTATATLWRWTGGSGSGTWHFVTFSGEAAELLSATALMRRLEGMRRGFGSLKVTATIGDSTWQTSVFPQKGEGWMLPVKKAILRAEDLAAGDTVSVTLEF